MDWTSKIGAILTIIIVLAIACVSCTVNFAESTYTGTVTDKERVTTSDESYYLVFVDLEDGSNRVFKNTDIWFRGKVDSSTIQGALKVGETYTFTVVGYRMPIWSAYENILEYEALE